MKTEFQEKELSGFSLLKRIALQAKPFWWHIIGIFILSLLATPIALLKPVGLKILIDSGFGSQALPSYITFFVGKDAVSFNSIVLITTVFIIIISVVNSLHGMLVWLFNSYTGEKMVLSLRTRLFNHIQRLSLAYHDRKGTSDALYRIQYDAVSIRSFLISNLTALVSAFIMLITMSAVMFFINWRFTLIALTVMLPLGVLMKISTRRLKRGWKRVKEDESKAMSVANEVLNSLRIVKAFGKEDWEGERFSDHANEAVKGQVKVAFTAAMFDFIVGLLFAVGTALFILFGARLVKSGSMTLGELTLVITYLGLIYGPLEKIGKSLNDIQSSLTSLGRIFSILDKGKEVVESEHPVHLTRTKGSIIVEGLSFNYNKSRPTLSDLNFEIKPGDRVGIMGSTGAGKSTLINLLCRFYDPSSGRIIMDGKDIRDYKLSDYRSQFAIVHQDPILFSNSIGENIAYGKPNATRKEIIEAAKSANAHDFIMLTPEGYDTRVGQRGMQLSGGERQRVSIARAFIKDAPILVLDEPTSSLDVRMESLIMEAMEKLMEGRTTFLITHRLDTLQSCNVILHLEKGKLVDLVRNTDAEVFKMKKRAFIESIA